MWVRKINRERENVQVDLRRCDVCMCVKERKKRERKRT